MSRRVRPAVVRHRLLALLEPTRAIPEWTDRSADWRAGYAAGLRVARDVIRKG